MTHTENHLLIEEKNALGTIILNRPASLNALSLEMINTIRQQVEAWQTNTNVQAILITSNSPKAFCAGGDIRYLYENYKSGSEEYKNYFIAEYEMLNSIRTSKKPVIVLLDGYVLGGGFGLAQACHILVSSEKSRFSMPETAIGFFPDVAATYFLSRLDDVGVYLALTGDQISSSDALYLDLIDYHVPSQDFNRLQNALGQAQSLDKFHIQQIISGYISSPIKSELSVWVEAIRKHFGFKNVEDIEQSLKNEQDPNDQVWTNKVLETLQQRSSVAKKTSLKLQLLGRGWSLQQCMHIERKLQDVWFEQGDIIEGVRALIIDKDKQPQWQQHNPTLDQLLDQLTES